MSIKTVEAYYVNNGSQISYATVTSLDLTRENCQPSMGKL